MTLITSAVTFIMMAFGFYTLAVWSERFAGRLKVWHLIAFWLGLLADTAGTSLMFRIADTSQTAQPPGFIFHSITGQLALVLMLVHTIWATLVLKRKDEKAIVGFHKFSTVVWSIWMIPFILGIIMETTR